MLKFYTGGVSCRFVHRLQFGRIIIKLPSFSAKQTKGPIFLTKNGEGDLVVMDIETYNRREKMISLREKLLSIEEDRIEGRNGCSVDDLEIFLDGLIEEV